MTTKAVIVLSGGQDSATCAFWAKEKGWELHAVTFDYGQRHIIELDAALTIGQKVGVASHEMISLGRGILKGTSPLVSANPLDQYRDAQSLPGGLEKTFVPMRNQLFLTLAANRAYVIGAQDLVTGVCQADSGGYPDCRERFIRSFEYTSGLGTFTGEDGAPESLRVHTPLMDLSKAQAVELALSLPGCYAALAYTHTAYDGQYPPMGRDHASLLRAKGFEEAGVPDPLVVRAYMEGRMPLPSTPNYNNRAMEKVHPLIADLIKEK